MAALAGTSAHSSGWPPLQSAHGPPGPAAGVWPPPAGAGAWAPPSQPPPASAGWPAPLLPPGNVPGSSERRAVAAERRTELLFRQLEQQQQFLEAATGRASEAEARLEALQREAAERRAESERESREERRRAAKRAAGQATAEAARRLATQQVAAAAAAEHLAGAEAALAELAGPLASELPAAGAAAVATAARKARAAAADLARLLQQQAQLEGKLAQAEGQEPQAGDSAATQQTPSRRLWIGGVTRRPTEKDVLSTFEKFGSVQSVRVLLQRRCVFVDYASSAAASKAMGALNNRAIPQLSGNRALVVQYQKETAASSPPSAAGAAAAAAAAALAPAHARGSKGAANGGGNSMLSALAPEWQPPPGGQRGDHDEWEAAADAAWAAEGGRWEDMEGEGGEEGDSLELLLLPSELLEEPSPRHAPPPLPMALGGSDGPSSSGGGGGAGSDGEPSCCLWAGNVLPQQRWKPADFTSKLEAAFSAYGRVEAVDVPKGRTFAFIHFGDSEAACKAQAALQGVVLPELTGDKPLRLKYSHSRGA